MLLNDQHFTLLLVAGTDWNKKLQTNLQPVLQNPDTFNWVVIK